MHAGSHPLLLLRNFASKVNGQVSGLMLLDLSASLDVSAHSLVPDAVL